MQRPGGWGILRAFRSAPEPTLAGRLVLTFLVVACCFAVLLGNNRVLFATCALTGTLVLSALVTSLSCGRLAVERTVPARVFAGAPFDVRLRVRNVSRWRPAFGLGFLDALQLPDGNLQTRAPVLPVLPPGSAVDVTYPRRIHRRGVYSVVNTLARTRFPFGLFERRVLVQSPARIVVMPALGRLRRAAARDLARRVTSPRLIRRGLEGSEEFSSLRDYRPGDNPRHIHWRTSARIGHLVRRVLRDEGSEDLHVVLDTCVAGAHAETRRAGLERAISCAATLLARAASRGQRAAVHFPKGSAAHAGTTPGLYSALEALAGVEAGETDAAQTVRALPLRRGAAALLISLAGPAPEARAAARSRGVALSVWDVADPAFERVFGRR